MPFPVRYQSAVRDKLGYLATWLPNAPLELGDVGVLADSRFDVVERLGSERLNVPMEVREGRAETHLRHRGGVVVSARAGAPGVEVSFKHAGAFVLEVFDWVERSIVNLNEVAEHLAVFAEDRKWHKSWVLIHSLVVARRATILVASSRGARIELDTSAALPGAPLEALDPAALGLSLACEARDVIEVVTTGEVTPLFRASRLSKRLLRKTWELSPIMRGPEDEDEDEQLLEPIDVGDLESSWESE